MPRIFAISRHRIATDGKGVTTLVTMHGCPLSCHYCLNPQCKDEATKFRDYTPQQLLSEVANDNLYFLATGGGKEGEADDGKCFLLHGFRVFKYTFAGQCISNWLPR